MIALPRPSLGFPAAVLLGVATLVAMPPLVVHLSSAPAALVPGLLVLGIKKGTPLHRMLGRAWVALMTLASLSSFWLTGLREGWS